MVWAAKHLRMGTTLAPRTKDRLRECHVEAVLAVEPAELLDKRRTKGNTGLLLPPPPLKPGDALPARASKSIGARGKVAETGDGAGMVERSSSMLKLRWRMKGLRSSSRGRTLARMTTRSG